MSALFWMRAFAFLILPLLLAGLVILFDKSVSTRERRLEVWLIYLFAFSAAGGIAGAFGHLFASDIVAESIGWEPGSPLQLEVGFVNLAFGIMAAVAVGRRDGFREATVLGWTIFSIGAFIVHGIDLAATNNLAPGNTLINITNLGRPLLLIYLMWALRQAERSPEAELGSPEFSHWQGHQAALGGTAGACVGVGFGIGLAMSQPLIGLIVGLVSGLALGFFFRRK